MFLLSLVVSFLSRIDAAVVVSDAIRDGLDCNHFSD